MPAKPPRRRARSAHAEIIVLAGVNGAGKSSIGGAYLRANAADYFNPDEAARKYQEANPGCDIMTANACAWEMGRRGLEQAIRRGGVFAFETTLGGTTITELLLKAARNGARLHVWYAGLSSVDLHLRRVRERVAKGGHDIPEADIRRRWVQSHLNLARLVPVVTSLRVVDNSLQADPWRGKCPLPSLVLEITDKELVFPEAGQLAGTPAWAKPIVLAACRQYLRK